MDYNDIIKIINNSTHDSYNNDMIHMQYKLDENPNNIDSFLSNYSQHTGSSEVDLNDLDDLDDSDPMINNIIESVSDNDLEILDTNLDYDEQKTYTQNTKQLKKPIKKIHRRDIIKNHKGGSDDPYKNINDIVNKYKKYL